MKIILSFAAAVCTAAVVAKSAMVLSADFAVEKGAVRRELHSSGYAPKIETGDETARQIRELNFHSVRTHDLALINPGQRIVDAHFVFPLMHLDAANPSNYYFKATDYMLGLSRDIGLNIFYRLGTSIEHSGLVHFNAQIPSDIDKMVEVFAGTVRHYNRGWADGKRWGIKYWEIWNEPNLDNAMWCFSGRNDGETPDLRRKLFVELYVKTLKRLKGEFPEIKVGGPALCWWDVPYLTAIFKGCKEAGVAPDFISWHYYGNRPDDIMEQAESARRLCDEYGFTDCELINDEWHFLGEGGFGALDSNDPVVQERVWLGPHSHNGIDSSCFALTVLSRLQTSKYSQAFYYGCRHNGAWGYMDHYGKKYKVWYALKAFGQLMKDCATLCESTREGTVTTFAAKSSDGKTGWLLVSDYCGKGSEIVVDVKNAGALVSAEIFDHERNFIPARAFMKDGRLTLKKEIDGSAAFLVKFDLSGNVNGGGLVWHCGTNARIEGKFLIAEVPKGEEKTGGLASAEIDLSAWDGKPVGASIVARGAGIAKPLHWYTGLKFQFEYVDEVTGEWSYPNTQGRLGDFPTQTIRVSDLVSGAKRSKARLMLGLQETSGKVVFDLSTLRIGEPVPLWPITNQNLKCVYSGKTEALRRGVMSPSRNPPPDMTIDDFDTLQSWGATLIRYQMGRNWYAQKVTSDLSEYDRWLDTKLDHFDTFVLPEVVKRGMKVVLDMHEAPGKKNEFNEWNMLHDPAVARHFVETWRRIAKRFKGREGIYGYDLVNEPMQASEAAPGCDFWTLQKRAAEAIREIDPNVPIIVECNGQDSPWAFGCFSPLDMTNVIYQVHMYMPLAYTHQGVMWKQGAAYRSYPDESKGWNKEYLRAGLRPVREFQLKHGAKIYCGEFSAVAWAPGAGEYLRDCIDIFEEYGWDWTYHAFREWEGWSVEHQGPNANGLAPAADTPRKRALLDGFGRGKKQ